MDSDKIMRELFPFPDLHEFKRKNKPRASKYNACETFCAYVADVVNSLGGHAHKNNARRAWNGATVKNGGEPFDFEFFGRKHLWLFDAKQTEKKYINLNDFIRRKNNQKQFYTLSNIMRTYEGHGQDFIQCGFLVFFKGLELNTEHLPNDYVEHAQFFHVDLIRLKIKLNHKRLLYWDGSNWDAGRIIEDCTGYFPRYVPKIRDFC